MTSPTPSAGKPCFVASEVEIKFDGRNAHVLTQATNRQIEVCTDVSRILSGVEHFERRHHCVIDA